MSLLNDVLHDLNKGKKAPKAIISTLVCHEKKTHFLHRWLVWLLAVFIISSVLALSIIFFQKIKYVKTTAIEKRQIEKPVFVSYMAKIPRTKKTRLVSLQQMQKKHATGTYKQRTNIRITEAALQKKQKQRAIGGNYSQGKIKATKKEVNKVYSPLSKKQWLDTQYQKAMDAYHQGDTHTFEAILWRTLTRYHDFNLGRERLILYLLAKDKRQKAMRLIDSGLSITPNYIPFIQIKAKRWIEERQYKKALALLNTASPNIRQFPSYYGLKAVVLNKLGKMNRSGDLYMALVQVAPNNGQYWLGFAVALEHNHHLLQALSAYERVVQSSDVKPEVEAYAQQKIRELKA